MKKRLFRSLAVFLGSVTVVCTVCVQKLSSGDVICSSGQIVAVSMHLAY